MHLARGLTNDTVLLIHPVGVKFCVLFLNHHTRAYFKLRWIWQVMRILEQSMVARLCDKYHNIVLAWLQFAHTIKVKVNSTISVLFV